MAEAAETKKNPYQQSGGCVAPATALGLTKKGGGRKEEARERFSRGVDSERRPEHRLKAVSLLISLSL